MSTPLPYVSVILPSYNREKLISASIQSVLDQGFADWELIVIDDGSEDNTRDVVARFGDRRISYYYHPHRGNLAQIRRSGLEYARGEWIAYIDSDDVWHAGKLQRQIDMISANPSVAYVLSNGWHFGPAATIQPPELPTTQGNLFHDLYLEHRFVIYMPSLLFRKSVFLEIDYPDSRLLSGADIDFVYRLAAEFPGVFLGEKLVGIRKHGEGMSAALGSMPLLDDLAIASAFLEKGLISHQQYRRVTSIALYQLALYHKSKKQIPEARANFRKVIAANPLHWRAWLRFLMPAVNFRTKQTNF